MKNGVVLGDSQGLCVYNYRHIIAMLSEFIQMRCNFVITKSTIVDIELQQLACFEMCFLISEQPKSLPFRNQKPTLAQFVSQNEYEKINT